MRPKSLKCFPAIITWCEITEFPGFRDTQKLCRKPNFLTRVSNQTPCKNQGLDSKLPFGNPERVLETQFLGVSFRKETQIFFVISHPASVPMLWPIYDGPPLKLLSTAIGIFY